MTSSQNDPQFSRSNRIEAMRELASAISFELTDMVTVIQHKLRMLETTLPKSEAAAKEIHKVRETLERMGALAKGMRSLGLSGESDGIQSVALKDILTPVLTLSRGWFDSQKVTLHQDPIPDVMVKGRPAQLSQSLLNLINNALDAIAPLKDKWAKIGFTMVGESPRRLQISITDSGKITPEVREKMFEPFFSTKPQGRGLGLGLNVAKSVAEAHSGKLYFDPASPNTRVVFEIPIFP